MNGLKIFIHNYIINTRYSPVLALETETVDVKTIQKIPYRFMEWGEFTDGSIGNPIPVLEAKTVH